MGIIIDIILVAILGLSIFLGYKKGLVGVVFNLCAFVVALVITFILYTPITNLVIENTEIDEKIESVIIENGVTEKQENENQEEQSTLDEYINKYVTDVATDAKNDVVQSSARIIAEKVVRIGVGIVLFIVVRILLIFVKFLAEGIANLPIIKQFNELGGILYGLLRGAIVVFVILAIVFFIVSVSNNEAILSTINSSYITKVLYANNIILNILF